MVPKVSGYSTDRLVASPPFHVSPSTFLKGFDWLTKTYGVPEEVIIVGGSCDIEDVGTVRPNITIQQFVKDLWKRGHHVTLQCTFLYI